MTIRKKEIKEHGRKYKKKYDMDKLKKT